MSQDGDRRPHSLSPNKDQQLVSYLWMKTPSREFWNPISKYQQEGVEEKREEVRKSENNPTKWEVEAQFHFAYIIPSLEPALLSTKRNFSQRVPVLERKAGSATSFLWGTTWLTYFIFTPPGNKLHLCHIKIVIKWRAVTRHWRGNCLIIKVLIHQEDIIVVNMYVFNIGVPKSIGKY